jgi:DNA-binding beta-propeller fold protein YncE
VAAGFRTGAGAGARNRRERIGQAPVCQHRQASRRVRSADGKNLWEKTYEGDCCDRIGLSPDGATIYAPAFGAPKWYVVDAASGALAGTIGVMGWPRQAIFSPDGAHVYLSAWESPVLSVVDAKSRKVVREVGPFTSFCAHSRSTVRRHSVCQRRRVSGLRSRDLQTGLVLDRVVIEGYQMEVGRSTSASHGIALTPDERELWVADGVDNRIHVFDAATIHRCS